MWLQICVQLRQFQLQVYLQKIIQVATTFMDYAKCKILTASKSKK